MPESTTMGAAATTAAGRHRRGRPRNGCGSGNRRGALDALHTLLAAIAVGARVVRILYPRERAAGFRPAEGCSVFSGSGSGPGNAG